MANMSDIMSNPDNPNVGQGAENGGFFRPEGYQPDPEMVEAAAALSKRIKDTIAPSDEEAAPTKPTEPSKPVLPEVTPVPKSAPTPTVDALGAGTHILTAEEIKALGVATEGEKIDLAAEEVKNDAAREAKRKENMNSNMDAMFSTMLAQEEARIERMKNIEKTDPKIQEQLRNRAESSVSTITESYEERKKDSSRSTNPDDDFDLLPSYDESPEDNASVEAEAVDPTEIDPDSEEYVRYIQNLELATLPEPKGTAVQRIREANVTVVPNGKAKTKANLGDQAFQTAVTKYKKDNFGKVTVPLVNSGFFADVVGTGVVDLQNLYLGVGQNTDPYDYQVEQMRTVFRQITGTSPRVNPNSLSQMIHYRDYNMLSYGHLCATLKTVETVANCTECGKAFRCSTPSENLLLNGDELYERRMQMEAADNIEKYSLMTKNREIDTSGGLKIVLSHPSYSETMRSIRGFRTFAAAMTDTERQRFEGMLDTLYMIRKIVLPNGITSSNIYQHYLALQLLSQEDLATVQRETDAMEKEVLSPRFGIREARCPYCGKVMKDIPMDSLQELLYFHVTITAILAQKVGDASGAEA